MTYRQALGALTLLVASSAVAPVGCCCVIPIPAETVEDTPNVQTRADPPPPTSRPS